MKNSPTVQIIATGSELLTGAHENTNAVFLSERLSKMGFDVVRHQTVGDDRSMMVPAIQLGLEQSDLVITTGGLGPTMDDMTRDAVSEATGIALKHSDEIQQEIEERFRSIGKAMPSNNLVQALAPERGGWFSNPHGTAPGLWFDLGEKLAVALPGPPRELNPMFEEHLAPLLVEKFDLSRHRLSRKLFIVAFGESNVEEITRPMIEKAPGVTYSILARPGIVQVTLSRWVDPEIESDEELDRLHEAIKEKLGRVVFTEEPKPLELVVGEMLKERGKTLVTAESCTGGLIAESITRVSGSSDWFLGGFVTYSNEMKISLLGVEPGLIEKHGAVSREVAGAMVRGALDNSLADMAVSVTGIAGPTGGSKEKPVGLVYVGIGDRERTQVEEYKFFGSREAVRERTRVAALNLVRLLLMDSNSNGLGGETHL
jgi:nicotinamide-nucleotide amidase